jgi:hypothetical protein
MIAQQADDVSAKVVEQFAVWADELDVLAALEFGVSF